MKTGVRGLGFVRTKPDVEWPADLQVKLPKPPEVNKSAAPASGNDNAPPSAASDAKNPDNNASEIKTPEAK